jgi:type I restriction enzyme S subunit
LEGLEVSEVLLSEIDLGDRFDAEFFEKEDLRVEKILRKLHSNELRTYGKFVASAFYPAATHLYEIGTVPFIRCVDSVKFPVITNEQNDYFEKIPSDFIENNSGVNTLEKGDIVITKVGTPSYPSIIYEHSLVALSRTVLGMKHIKNINPYYLLIFLRSKYGFSQLQRHRELTIQYQLTLERTKRTLVFEPSITFQNEIELLVHQFIEGLNKSKDLYSKSEAILLEEIDLKDYTLNKESVNIKTFSNSFLRTGRLDAEYYQPKYDEIVEKIKSQPYDNLINIVSIKKSIEPGSKNYSEEGLPFMRVADYSKFSLTEPQKYLTSDFVSENKDKIKKLKPKKGTILFSKDGSVGTAYHLREDFNGITSGAILHLKVKDESKIIPEYLTLALNSQVVQMQAERDAGGSIILHWRVSEIENVLVPVIDYTKQQEIAALVEESFSLKKQSEYLLEVAKKAVEIAIEEGEKEALQYINLNS